MTANNHYGIFKTKKAKFLAVKYNLDLYNYNLYSQTEKYVTYLDVLFIVENLWLDHFMYYTEEPLKLLTDQYDSLYYSLSLKYPHLLNYN